MVASKLAKVVATRNVTKTLVGIYTPRDSFIDTDTNLTDSTSNTNIATVTTAEAAPDPISQTGPFSNPSSRLAPFLLPIS